MACENPQQSSLVSTVYILEKLHSCMFFDEEILTSMFFPTLHDTMLHVLEKHKGDKRKGRVVRKTISITFFLYWVSVWMLSIFNETQSSL